MIAPEELFYALILLAALFFTLVALAAVSDALEWVMEHKKTPHGRQPNAAHKKYPTSILRQKEADVK